MSLQVLCYISLKLCLIFLNVRAVMSKLKCFIHFARHFEDISTNLQGETIGNENGFQHHPTYTSLVC